MPTSPLNLRGSIIDRLWLWLKVYKTALFSTSPCPNCDQIRTDPKSRITILVRKKKSTNNTHSLVARLYHPSSNNGGRTKTVNYNCRFKTKSENYNRIVSCIKASESSSESMYTLNEAGTIYEASSFKNCTMMRWKLTYLYSGGWGKHVPPFVYSRQSCIEVR